MGSRGNEGRTSWTGSGTITSASIGGLSARRAARSGWAPMRAGERAENEAAFSIQRVGGAGASEEGPHGERGGPFDRRRPSARGEGDREDDGGALVRGGPAAEGRGVGVPVRLRSRDVAVRRVPCP